MFSPIYTKYKIIFEKKTKKISFNCYQTFTEKMCELMKVCQSQIYVVKFRLIYSFGFRNFQFFYKLRDKK